MFNKFKLLLLKFKNLRNFLTLRSFAILSLALIISFLFRLYIVYLWELDLSLFKDFMFIGLLASLFRPLITDFADIFFPSTLRSSFNILNSYGNFNKDSYNKESIGYKIKRRLFWEIWESDKDTYRSYKHFKRHWDSNTSIKEEIKKEFRKEFPEFIRRKRKIVWIYNRWIKGK